MDQILPGEGYLKFDCRQTVEDILMPPDLFATLNSCRKALWGKQLIGVYPDGIGYGNISVRIPGTSRFYISGTATGGIPDLNLSHYAQVERCDPATNTLWCRGRIKASAESMSHDAVYRDNPRIGAVVHVHSRRLWQQNLNLLPTTDPLAAYGTPEMATEIGRIMKLEETADKKVIVMGGHEEGILTFGITIEEAAQVILNLVDG